MDLSAFAAEVGDHGPVTVAGLGTRGGAVAGVRAVSPPSGIERIQPEEMTVSCAAGTPVDDLVAALAEHGQTVNLPAGGTVGGALSVGRSDYRLLGYGPLRDVLLQMHYVSASGEVVMAGGPTVKNVSGFDLCRLFVGARGTLGFLGSVILRTRPIPTHSAWFRIATADPRSLLAGLFRPISVLWDGEHADVLLEGHPADVAAQAAEFALAPCEQPMRLPTGRRWTASLAELVASPPDTRPFVALVGTGVVAGDGIGDGAAAPGMTGGPDAARHQALAAAVKHRFDPEHRLNPHRYSHGNGDSGSGART